MTRKEYEYKCDMIKESYYAKDIGEIDGTEGTVFWHPDIDGTRIETVVNNKIPYHYFRYIRSKADDEYGKICRIRIDVPEYVYHKGDIILTKQERSKLIQILNSKRIWYGNKITPMWNCIIDSDWDCYRWYGGSKNRPTSFPPMPDYSNLITSD